MNKTRRKVLTRIKDSLSDACENIEILYDEEYEYLENMPENLQNSERHEQAENAVSSLDEAMTSINNAIDCIEEAIG